MSLKLASPTPVYPRKCWAILVSFLPPRHEKNVVFGPKPGLPCPDDGANFITHWHVAKPRAERLCLRTFYLRQPAVRQVCGRAHQSHHRQAPGRCKNSNPQLRTQSCLGLVFIQNFTFAEGNKWDKGKIYSPEDGRTYSASLTMKTINELELRGYIGFSLLGQSQTWTRIN